jgi:hypothetical protein
MQSKYSLVAKIDDFFLTQDNLIGCRSYMKIL